MFGAICAGRAVQTNIQAVSETQFIFHLPLPSTINHLVVFLLPEGAALLPPSHGATVHVRFPGHAFRLLGAISLQKPSAIFRLRTATAAAAVVAASNCDAMVDGREDEDGDVILGISVEPLESVQAQLATLPTDATPALTTTAVVKQGATRPGTAVLARRIIRNAFDFVSSFASESSSGDVIPLKAFQDWWTKFEKKIEYDPTFLEREE